MKKLVLVLVMLCFGAAAFAQGVETKHRVGVFGGYFYPSGAYEESGVKQDFQQSFNYGIDYNYILTEMLSVGVFVERRAFETDSEFYAVVGSSNTFDMQFNGSNTIFGISGTLMHNINKLQLFGTGKLGYAMTTLELEISNSSDPSTVPNVTDDTNGTAFAFILEAGVRYKLSDLVDLGLFAKYTHHKQEFEDSDEKIDLGGLAILAGVGFNF